MPKSHDFVRAVLDPETQTPVGIVARGRRFDIYRNNVFVSLANALATTFPVIRKMLGDEYFQALAQVYIRRTPPDDPILAEYGASFPAFLREFPPLAEFPYLHDVARLELARIEAMRAPDHLLGQAEDLDIEGGAGLLAHSMALSGSARLLRSDYPIDTLWTAHQVEQPIAIENWNGEALLIFRRSNSLVHAVIGEPEYGFLASLSHYPSLGDALVAIGDEEVAAQMFKLTINLFDAGGLVALAGDHLQQRLID